MKTWMSNHSSKTGEKSATAWEWHLELEPYGLFLKDKCEFRYFQWKTILHHSHENAKEFPNWSILDSSFIAKPHPYTGTKTERVTILQKKKNKVLTLLWKVTATHKCIIIIWETILYSSTLKHDRRWLAVGSGSLQWMITSLISITDPNRMVLLKDFVVTLI